jgi:hypothetical protein
MMSELGLNFCLLGALHGNIRRKFGKCPTFPLIKTYGETITCFTTRVAEPHNSPFSVNEFLSAGTHASSGALCRSQSNALAYTFLVTSAEHIQSDLVREFLPS